MPLSPSGRDDLRGTSDEESTLLIDRQERLRRERSPGPHAFRAGGVSPVSNGRYGQMRLTATCELPTLFVRLKAPPARPRHSFLVTRRPASAGRRRQTPPRVGPCRPQGAKALVRMRMFLRHVAFFTSTSEPLPAVVSRGTKPGSRISMGGASPCQSPCQSMRGSPWGAGVRVIDTAP